MRYLRWSIIVIIIAAAGFAIYSAYSYLKKVEENSIHAEDVLPENVLFLYESKKILEDWRHLKSSSVIWENAISSGVLSQFDNAVSFADSVLIENTFLEDLINHRKTSLSIHYNNGNPTGLLILELLVNDDHTKFMREIEASIPQNWQVEKEQIEQVDFLAISSKAFGKIYLGMYHNLVLASADVEILKSVQSTKDNNKLAQSLSLTGKGFDVHGSVYVNYELFHLYCKNNLNKSPLANLIHQEVSVQDIHVDAQSFQLNGILEAGNESRVARLLADFPNEELFIHRYIPYDALGLVRLSLPMVEGNDISPLSSVNLDFKEFNERAISTDERIGADVRHQLFSWMGNEVAVGISKKNKKFLTIMVNPATVGLEEMLSDYSKAALAYEGLEMDTLRIGDFYACQSRLPFGYNNLLGGMFSMDENVWLATDGKIVVVASSKSEVKQYIWSLKSKSLADLGSFSEQISSNMASKSILFAFVKPGNLALLKELLGDSQYARVEEHQEFIDGISFGGLQLVRNENNFSYNLVMSYQGMQEKTKDEIWELQIEKPLIAQPRPIYNHRSKSTNFIVQDSANKVYLISATGKTIWTKQLDGKILGDISQIDIYKNDKLQMICNTAKTLYGIDILGRDLKNFPIKLPSKTALSHVVFDYEDNHDYRIIVPSAGDMYNYTAEGTRVKGWKFEELSSTVATRPQHYLIEGKDVIVFTDGAGGIHYINRRGEKLEDISSIITNLPACKPGQSFFERSNELVTSKFIYLDTNHHVISTYLGGTRDSLFIAGEDDLVSLRYLDVNADESKDYVVFSNSKIWSFNKDKSSIFTIQKPDAQESYIYTYKQSISYGIMSPDGSVNVYNKFGDLLFENVQSVVQPIYGDFNGDGAMELIVADKSGLLKALAR